MSKKKSKSVAGRAAVVRATGEPPGSDASFSDTGALLAWVAPVAPPPSARVKEQLMARVRAANAATTAGPANPPQGWRFESVAAAEGWREATFPGVRFKTLSVDEQRDVVMLLIEIAPGARFPDHLHDAGGDEGIVLSGDVITAGRLMRAGDYYHAAEGTAHTGTLSPHGCTALVSLTATAWQKWQQAVKT